MAQGGGSAQVDARAGLLVSATLASSAEQKSGALRNIGTISITPPDAAAHATVVDTATIAGAKAGDLVFVMAPDTLEDGLVPAGAAITGANTVTVVINNATAGALNSNAAREWFYLLFRIIT